MPKPEPGEKLGDYVGRYVSSGEATKSFPDKRQRLAVAYSEYARKAKDVTGKRR